MATKVLDINKLIGNSYFILKKLIGAGVQIPGEFADNLPVHELPYQEEEEEQGTGQRQETQYTAPVGNIILEDEKTLQTIARYESTEAQTIYNTSSLVKQNPMNNKSQNIEYKNENIIESNMKPIGLEDFEKIIIEIYENIKNFGIYDQKYLNELEDQIDNFEAKNQDDIEFKDELKMNISEIRKHIELEELQIKIMKSKNDDEKKELNNEVKNIVNESTEQTKNEIIKLLEDSNVNETTKNDTLTIFTFVEKEKEYNKKLNEINDILTTQQVSNKDKIIKELTNTNEMNKQKNTAAVLTLVPPLEKTNEEDDIKKFYKSVGLTDEELGLTTESPNITNQQLISMYNSKKANTITNLNNKPWTIDKQIGLMNDDLKKQIAGTVRRIINTSTSENTPENLIMNDGNKGIRNTVRTREVIVRSKDEKITQENNEEKTNNTNRVDVKTLPKIPIAKGVKNPNTTLEPPVRVVNNNTPQAEDSKKFTRPRQRKTAWENYDNINQEAKLEQESKIRQPEPIEKKKEKTLNLTNPIQSSVIKRPTFEELKNNTLLTNEPDTLKYETLYKKILEEYSDKIGQPLNVENTNQIANDLKITDRIEKRNLSQLLKYYDVYLTSKTKQSTSNNTSTHRNIRPPLKKDEEMFVEDAFDE